MNILIIGSDGFIGKNLYQRLINYPEYKIFRLRRNSSKKIFRKYINLADVIFHLAGANRENNEINFKKKNLILTKKICDLLKTKKKITKFIYTSTIHAKKKNPYGISKIQSEKELIKINKKKINLYIYRLSNVFGKWSKPFYNSVVATFCHQIIQKKKLKIIKNDLINFIYIDDLINNFIKLLNDKRNKNVFMEVKPQKKLTVKMLARKLLKFKDSLKMSEIPNIKDNFDKKLYSTYLSYMDQNNAYFKVNRKEDIRGEFTELFKNEHSQVSFFSINKNQTRGSHYHDTKTEKFFLISGKVRFEFINIISKKKYTKLLNNKNKKVIFTIPGWSHKIKNVGNDKAIFAVWANEKFDINKPDTYYYNF